jgi:hypothetical protein
MGHSQGALRLPLTQLTEPSQQMLERVLQSIGLI